MGLLASNTGVPLVRRPREAPDSIVWSNFSIASPGEVFSLASASRLPAVAPFTMLASILEANPYLGRLLTGRIQTGTVKTNMPIKALNREGQMIEQGRVQVNGKVVTELGTKADSGRDHIRVDGKLLQGAERLRYFMLNHEHHKLGLILFSQKLFQNRTSYVVRNIGCHLIAKRF